MAHVGNRALRREVVPGRHAGGGLPLGGVAGPPLPHGDGEGVFKAGLFTAEDAGGREKGTTRICYGNLGCPFFLATSHWASRDLLGVLVGALGACLIIYLWAVEFSLPTRLVGSALGLLVALLGYTYPVVRYLQRSGTAFQDPVHGWRPTLGRMLLGACLSGVALLGTWGSIQWAPSWADRLTGGTSQAKEYTQIWSALGAIVGTMLAARLGDWIGRRPAYTLLCLGSLGSILLLFQLNDRYGATFLAAVFLAGGITASFYGWLPLYLPELFRTGVRATGQGFSYNFGRTLAAVGVLQTGFLMKEVFKEDYAMACSVMSLIYVVGVVLIWLVPETRGKPLPE
jgi:hypothetical protein